MRALRDQTYETEGGGSLFYDLFVPDSDQPLPLVIFLHGGGWISGDKEMMREEAVWLVHHGFACACIEYRLAPLYPFPACVADCQAFVRFARENAEDWGIDPGKIAALGNSAGGHLACMMGLCTRSFDGGPEDGSQLVNAVVDVCGITDLQAPEETHYPIAMSFVEQFMGKPHSEDSDSYCAASPIQYVGENPPPFLIVHGDADDVVPVDQSRRLKAALEGAGGSVRYIELENEGHAFTLEAWGEVRFAYLDFLRETLC